MPTFITKRRLATLASMAAVVATTAVAVAPAATVSAASCEPTGFIRDGIDLTAAKHDIAVTGNVDAAGCDIAVYNPTSVINADIHGARYYGVVVNGKNVNITGSKVHQIGESPFDGMQHGRAILYINGATGTISGNKVYDFQKNGIEIRGVTADASGPSAETTSAKVVNNLVTGRGAVDSIAQNGIVVLGNASATIKDNTVSGFQYTGPEDTYATGLLNVDVAASKITVSGNRITGADVAIDGAVIANVGGAAKITVVTPRRVDVLLHSGIKPGADAVLGTRLDWRVTVDGKTVLHTKQGFNASETVIERFAAHSGRHVIQVFKNGVLAERAVVRS